MGQSDFKQRTKAMAGKTTIGWMPSARVSTHVYPPMNNPMRRQRYDEFNAAGLPVVTR